MRQTFDETTDPSFGAKHLPLLRAEMAKQGLDGLLVPHEDEHQNEYLPEANDRLAWATGFTGSAGVVVVLPDKAALFVDGRYTLQAGTQVDTGVFTIVHSGETSPEKWLGQNLPAGAKLGYDPWLHTVDGAERLARTCTDAGATAVPTEPDPVDAIWTDRPAPPLGAVVLHEFFAALGRWRRCIHRGGRRAGAHAVAAQAQRPAAWRRAATGRCRPAARRWRGRRAGRRAG